MINKYYWEGKSFPSEKVDRQKLEKDNVTIAINVLYAKKEKIHPAYDYMFLSCHVRVSEWILILQLPECQGTPCSKQANIKSWKTSYSFNDFKLRRMALSCSQKKLSVLRRITSKHHSDVYCLNCSHSFAIEQNFNRIKEYVKIRDFVTLLCLLKTLKC